MIAYARDQPVPSSGEMLEDHMSRGSLGPIGVIIFELVAESELGGVGHDEWLRIGIRPR